MRCLECDQELERIDNRHLASCCGLTLQEYAIRYHLPLDLLLHFDQINCEQESLGQASSERYPGEVARAVLLGLHWSGLLETHENYVQLKGNIRQLDLLLWLQAQLQDYGFQYQQLYHYNQDTHRVVASNVLRTLTGNLLNQNEHQLAPVPPPDFLTALAICTALIGDYQSGYLFLNFSRCADAELVMGLFTHQAKIHFDLLDTPGNTSGGLLRTCTPEDSERLFILLDERLGQIPGARERFQQSTPILSVTKELVFDAAHFISDHPTKCSNLHGGRYRLEVQVRGRMDPVTGCVVDYGYLKRMVNGLIIERFDHHNLNYVTSELAWRSSTEMLCVYIWEQLIKYLPGLQSLRLFETTQSWCDYQGPSLAEFQQQGSSLVLHYFEMLDPSGRALYPVPDAPKLTAVRNG